MSPFFPDCTPVKTKKRKKCHLDTLMLHGSQDSRFFFFFFLMNMGFMSYISNLELKNLNFLFYGTYEFH